MQAPMLEGTAVLDLSSVGPAARASRWLADYGASVTKVGPVASRSETQIAPPFHSYSGHRGMKRVLVDLKAAGGRDAFLRMAERADVVIESFRPGVVDRLGIGYEAVSARNAGVVYCSTSGFGQTGPAAGWAGHDLNYLAMGGYLACCEPAAGGAPPLPGATVADSAAGGMQAVMAITAALVRRARTGEGAFLDVSVADGVLALMALAIDEHLATGAAIRPGHGILTGRYACYATYATNDGKHVSVAAIEPKFWANLCAALGLDRWAHHQLDDDVQDDIRADLGRVFASRSRDEWVGLLAGADTCVAPVLEVDEVVADPHFAARGAVVAANHPEHGPLCQIAPVLAGMQPAEGSYELPSLATTDTVAVLRASGLSAAEVDALVDAGVVA